MFYVFDQLPELPRLDFRNNASVNPDSFAQLNVALQNRIELQKYIAKTPSIASNEVAPMSDKLSFSYDLLEICDKEQIIPEGTYYKGFLKNTGKILKLFYNPETICVTDMIYSRYAFSFATLRSAKDECENIRKVIHQLDVYNDMIKSIIDKLLIASARIYKMVANSQLVFTGLGANSRLFELNYKTAQALDDLFRINFGSILMIKTLATSLNPDKAVFLAQLCKRTYNTTIKSKTFWEQANAPQFQSIVDFCDIASNFFYLMSMYCVIKTNQYENDGLLKKNKDYKLIIWENYMLSDEIRKVVKQMSTQKYKSNDHFNIEENRRMFQMFYDVFMTTLTDECIKNFTYLQDQLVDVPRNGPKNAINTIALTNDFVESILKQQ